MYIYIYIQSLYSCTIYTYHFTTPCLDHYHFLELQGPWQTGPTRFTKQPGFWRSFCCNPQRWQGLDMIHGTEKKKRAFEKDFWSIIRRCLSCPSEFLFIWVYKGLFESYLLFFCWVFSCVQYSEILVSYFRGHQITNFLGIKQYKSTAILRDFSDNNALFGLVV